MPSPARDAPLVSVIVPAWNAETTIGACLDALTNQTFERERYEVILVDNGSTDDTLAVAARHPGVATLVDPTPGSYSARNTGLSAAKGRYIAFTDADCIPAPDWLERGLATAEARSAAIVAGAVRVAGEAPSLVKIYEEVFAFRQEHNVARGQCVTANWLSPAEILRRYGGFDPQAKSGGDWELSRRIAADGLPVVYEPAMIVTHPPRASIAEIAVKRRRVAGGRWMKSGGGLGRALRIESEDLARKLMILGRQPHLPLGWKVQLAGLLAYFWQQTTAELVRLKLGGKVERR